jgi:hypothetical protein
MCGTKIETTKQISYFLEVKLEVFHRSKELPNTNIT